MSYVEPALRDKRKSRTAWARAHIWDGCAICRLDLGALTEATDGSHVPRILARQYLRQQGFDPSLPLGVADHIVALFEGGAESEENLQILCQICHKRKNAEEAKRRSKAPKHVNPIGDYEAIS